MFGKIGKWLDGVFKPVTDWWLNIYREKCDDGFLKGCWIGGSWLAVCFGPLALYLVHKFVLNLWLATFTSATPFADHFQDLRIQDLNNRAILEKAKQCIIDYKENRLDND